MLDSRRARKLVASTIILAVAVVSVWSLKHTRTLQDRMDIPSYRQKGDRNAPVALIEFSDFQCPSCKAAQESLGQIQHLFPGKIIVGFKYYPLENIHPWAKAAAQSAECAGRQDKFWEYHDLLFDQQPVWAFNNEAPRLFQEYAQRLGLNPDTFNLCVKDGSTAEAVNKDALEAIARFVESTPTFFINGKRFVGNRQLQTKGIREIEKILNVQK